MNTLVFLKKHSNKEFNMAVTKPKLLTMKVDETEKQKWKQMAKERGISLAELIRTLLDGQPVPKTKRLVQVIEVDPELLFELNAISNNMSKLSRRVNTSERFSVLMELKSIEQMMERLLHAYKVS